MADQEHAVESHILIKLQRIVDMDANEIDWNHCVNTDSALCLAFRMLRCCLKMRIIHLTNPSV